MHHQQYRFACPATSACFRLSLPRHLCTFALISYRPLLFIYIPPPLPVCVYLCLHPSFCPFASISSWPILLLCACLYPATTVRIRLSLPRQQRQYVYLYSANSVRLLLLLVCQQCPFTFISTPHTFTTDRLCLSLSGHFCSFASICSAKSIRLPVSATQTIPGYVDHFSVRNAYLHPSLHHLQCTFASISSPPTMHVCVYLCLDISDRLCLPLPRKLHPFAPLPFCVYICPVTTVRLFLSTPCQQCLFSFISHPTTMLICVYLCPATSAPVCLSLKTTSARLRLSLLRQQCTFTSIFDSPTLTAITAQLALSLCVCLSRHICLFASIATPPTLSVAFYNVPVNTFSLRLSLAV